VPCQLHVRSSPPPPNLPSSPFEAKRVGSAGASASVAAAASTLTSAPAPAAAAAIAPLTPRLTKTLSFADQVTENDDPSPTLLSSPRYRGGRGGALASPRGRTVESFSFAVAVAASAASGDGALDPVVTPRSNRRPSSALSVCTSSGGTDDNGTRPSALAFFAFAAQHVSHVSCPFPADASSTPRAHSTPRSSLSLNAIHSPRFDFTVTSSFPPWRTRDDDDIPSPPTPACTVAAGPNQVFEHLRSGNIEALHAALAADTPGSSTRGVAASAREETNQCAGCKQCVLI